MRSRFLLNLHIKITEQDSFVYSLNEQEKTASVISNKSQDTDIIIPRSINYNGQEYIITSISEDAFRDLTQLKSIQFPPDSEIQKIEQNAFFNSTIESFTIPSKLKELDDGWCNMTTKLNKISVGQDNQYFTIYNDKFILRKSTSNKENFDVLVFCVRDVEKVTVPNFIEIIGPYAFENCN